ncbi:MAG: energy transducer TonB [Polyangiaceae bacterium]
MTARPSEGSRMTRWGFAGAVALGAHVALAFGASAMPQHSAAAPIVTELELAPPPEPPRAAEPPKPEPPKPEPDETDEPPRSTEPLARANVNSAPAARAGKLLTVKEDAPTPPGSEPVDFVTDPNGSTYAGGIVARGATGGHGSTGTSPRPASTTKNPTANTGSARKRETAPTPILSRAASLASGTNCAGYYPRSADADAAIVTLVIVVSANGSITRMSVASESPAGQGFGSAARACIGTGRFRPALDEGGRAVQSATRVRVRFTR